MVFIALVLGLAPAALVPSTPLLHAASSVRTRFAVTACIPDDRYDDDEEDEMIDADEDLNTAWQRYQLEGMLAIPTMYDSHQPVTKTEQLASVFFATLVFLGILHACALAAPFLFPPPRLIIVCAVRFADLLHAGGGLVIVPEGDFVGIYNFHELQHMDKTHLLRLGLPMPSLHVPPRMMPRQTSLEYR